MCDFDASVHVLGLYELDDLVKHVMDDKVIILLRYLPVVEECQV